jgi:hypothetical protein
MPYSFVNGSLNCIFRDYVVDGKKACSNIKTAGLVIVCDNHSRQFLNFVAKREIMTPHLYQTVQTTVVVLNFCRILHNEFLPFPFKFVDGKFCLDSAKLQRTNYHNGTLLPILGSLASDGLLQDLQIKANTSAEWSYSLESYNVAQYLMGHKLRFDTEITALSADISIFTQLEDGSTELIPLAKFPFFYKWIILHMFMSNIVDRATVGNEGDEVVGRSQTANVMCSVKAGAFLLINVSKQDVLMLNTGEGKETFASPVVIAATKVTDNLAQEAVHRSPISKLVRLPNICQAGI